MEMELLKGGPGQYEEYETLLLERDQLRKEAGQIWTAYIQNFGGLIADLYEVKVECVKCRKTIAFYQQALNRGGVVDQDALQTWLDQEMSAFYANLRRLQDDYERCRDVGSSTGYEVQRSRTLYRRLARLIHPDIYPETDRRDVLKDLWQRILTAYGHNDVKALSELEVLVRRALKDLGDEEIRADIPDIGDRIEELKAEIHEITHTDPYTYRDLLEEDAAREKKEELQRELNEYRKYHEELKEIILQMITDGGIELKWQMN